MSEIDFSNVTMIKSCSWLETDENGCDVLCSGSYIFYEDGKVEWNGTSNPPNWFKSQALDESYTFSDNLKVIEAAVDGPTYQTGAKSYFELAVLLASKGFEGKKRPEFLSRILRDLKYELTIEDRNQLADYIEGKLNNGSGRTKKGQSSINFVGVPITAERMAAHRVLAQMADRRANGEQVRNMQPKLIEEISAEEKADPVAVAELLRTRR